jgi:uncharacterized protein (TIGR02145 family)
VNNGAYEGTSTINNWATTYHADYPFQGGSEKWIETEDPCPAGWKLPTNDEWAGVVFSNTSAIKHFVYGVETTTNWKEDNNSNPNDGYNDVIKIGDHLYLPAAGDWGYRDGQLRFLGNYGCYWSSSTHVPTGVS